MRETLAVVAAVVAYAHASAAAATWDSVDLAELDDRTSVFALSGEAGEEYGLIDHGVESSDLGERANPIAANPAPRDFFKLPNTRLAGHILSCNGVFEAAIPTGDLKMCGDTCTACPLCRGFVHSDQGNGKCEWKSEVPSDECLPPSCKQDSYAKCPKGRWSDGSTTSAQCFQSPRGFSRIPGTCACPTSGTDIACNSGSALYIPNKANNSYNLQECADMCRTCANGALKCTGFIRGVPTDQPGAECRFKSVVSAADAVNNLEDMYIVCPPGTWSDGTFTQCKPAPKNYKVLINKDAGNDINCHFGSAFMEYGDDGNLTACADTCNKCVEGASKCIGFIRREDGKCNFKGATADGVTGESTTFASTASEDRDAYVKCPDNKWSDGTMNTCTYPDDWKVHVVTGSGDECQCNNKPVNDRRFSSATFTFDVLSGKLPMFLSSKPEIVSPCADSNSTDCAGKSDNTTRTSGAGALPTKVRITADSNDAWCMKSFCISSAKLGKKWVHKTPQWLNPGAPDDGKCLPATSTAPNNNWGWCRFVAGGVNSNMTNCNNYNSFSNAYWEIEVEEGSGAC